MRIARVDILKYHLPLVKPYFTGQTIITAREGLIVRLVCDNGFWGVGEVAPFPGLNKESLEEAISQLCEIRPKFIQAEIPVSFSLGDFFEINGIEIFTFYPSVRFGLESAFVFILANFQDRTVTQLLYNKNIEVVQVNALLDAREPDVISQAIRLVKDGFHTIKMKVGRQSITDEINLLKKFHHILGDQCELRLDANRAWTLEEAVTFGRAVRDCNIAYIEEPLQNPEKLTTFYQETQIPFALDEYLIEIGGDLSRIPVGAAAIVIKPGVLGGVQDLIQIARQGEKQGISPIFSCPFYSSIGSLMVAQMATGFINKRREVGLDTLKWFKEDLLQKPVEIEKSKIHLTRSSENLQTIRYEMLETIH